MVSSPSPDNKFKTLFDALSQGIQEIDSEGTILLVNRAYNRILGYDDGELVGRSIFDLTATAREGAALRDTLQRVASAPIAPTPHEMAARRKDGQVVDVRLTWDCIRDGHGQAVGFIALVSTITARPRTTREQAARRKRNGAPVADIPHEVPGPSENGQIMDFSAGDVNDPEAVVQSSDTTAGKRAEETLAEKERQLRQITDQIPGMVFQFVIHPDGGFSVPYVSEGFEAVTGIPAAELATSPQRFLDGIHPDDAQRMWEALARSAETLSAFRLEQRIVLPDGTHRWFLFRSAPTEQASGAILWHGVAIDISERVEADRALEESRNQLEAVLNAVNITAVLVNADGTVLACNPVAARQLGMDRSALVGTNIFAILPPAVAESRRKRVREVIRTGEPAHFVDSRQGMVFDNSITPIYNADGDCTAVAIQAIDITQSHRLAEEQEQLLSLLRLINAATPLKHLISGVIRLLSQWTGVEAVGIRIRRGNDFPYYEWRGFPESFVATENSLCARDERGKTITDAAGNPILACMCGNVLEGRFDPSKPFFTGRGSFWTNSTSRLLASTSEEDRMARTRNRCHGEGYESVALIPMRVGGDAIGLIQFCDRSEDKFDAAFLKLFERMADHLSVAISQRIAEEDLKNKTQELEDMNTALKVLLKKREEDILIQGKQVRHNVRDLVSPYLHKLKGSGLNSRQESLVAIVEKHIIDISSPFARKLNAFNGTLTPALLQVANLVKQGASSKEIAQSLGISVKSVETYRKRLRERLDIKNKKTNLRAFLLSLE